MIGTLILKVVVLWRNSICSTYVVVRYGIELISYRKNILSYPVRYSESYAHVTNQSLMSCRCTSLVIHWLLNKMAVFKIIARNFS